MTSAACDVAEISRGHRTRSVRSGAPRWLTTRAALRAVPTVAVALMFATGAAPAMAAETPRPASVQASRSSAAAPDHDHDSMPGMDMPAEEMPAEEMPAEVDGHAESVDRPRGPLIGAFVGINAAVLLAASVLRRRTKAERDHPRTPRALAATAR